VLQTELFAPEITGQVNPAWTPPASLDFAFDMGRRSMEEVEE